MKDMLIIREEYVELCKDPKIALVLSYLAYWQGIKDKASEQARGYNDIAETHGDARSQYEGRLHYHKTEDIYKGTFGLIGKKAIPQAIEKLVEMGIVSIHKNPNPKYSFDNSKWFFVDLRRLDEMTSSIYPKRPDDLSKTDRRSIQNDQNNNRDLNRDLNRDKKEPNGSKKNRRIGRFVFSLPKKTPISQLSKEYLDRLKAYAITQDAASEFEAFVDHHIQHGKAMKDWAAAYRTWLRNVEKFGGQKARPIRAMGSSGVEVYLDEAREHVVEADDESYTLYRVRTTKSGNERPEEAGEYEEPRRTPGAANPRGVLELAAIAAKKSARSKQ